MMNPGIKGRLKSESGQSLILAIIVMMLLVFISVVFVMLVARNQGRAGRSRDVLIAQYLAEAGVQYADRMLQTSDKGADWRPEPDNITDANHPDYKWLKPYDPTDNTGGFTSYNMGEGRYLIRVSYNPNPDDPLSKYIKIESIGRVGTVENDDPTTWDSNLRLRRELTAYKPIGVTDYLRFVTNKDKRSAEIPLGAAGFKVKYGNETPATGDVVRGAPIRVNGNLTWYGEQIDLVLRGRRYNDGTGDKYVPIDMVEVAGRIRHETVDMDGAERQTQVTLYEIINNGAPVAYTVHPSDSTNLSFTTANGFYRDGSDAPDYDRQARGIKRLEPPILDADDTPSRVPRYLALTRDSGIWLQRSDGTWINSGRYGWGSGVYINNSDDLQRESETLFGGYTPRADWMKPNNDMSAYWQGPYYVPPGVIITLNPYDTDGDGEPDITITRTDIKGRRNDPFYARKVVWYNPVGQPMHNIGATITIPYPQGTQTFTYEDNGTTHTMTIDRNGVIYADGNIRIKGMLAEGKQLTVVSGGIIYIEGNILKYRDEDGRLDKTSAISLLAKQYVCVNTTQFMSLMSSLGPSSIGSDSGTGQPPYHLIITPEPSTTFYTSFSFGPPTGRWQMDDSTMLFVRHAGQYGPAYINMWLNRSTATPNQGLLPIGIDDPNLPPVWVYGCGDPRYCAEGTGVSSMFEHKVFDSSIGFEQNYLYRAIGRPNYFEIGIDQSSFSRNNYQLSALAIQPLDIRVEAVMYAQDRSFFIIPGNWFNMNATDIGIDKYRPRGVDPRWPLFGQPLDTKITIDGAITENYPALVGDVSEWYSKWSNIPEYYGTSDVPTAHPGDGLTFLYDPMVGWPVVGNTPVRTDSYGRALPITPCLPVCRSLYYYGEPT